MNYTTGELASITNSELFGNEQLPVENIAFDTRNIFSSTRVAFIALTTEKSSGERFITEALEKGVQVIIAKSLPVERTDFTWIKTTDPLRFLQILAKWHFSQFAELKTIGITGSNGKTVLKEWLYQSLCNEHRVVKSPKSYNSLLGLPLSLLKIEKAHEIGIFEVGISKPKEMDIQSGLFLPQIGILTHIGTAHLSNFASQEEQVREKLKLFTHCSTLIYNGDNLLVHQLVQELYPSTKKVSFGLAPHNTLHFAALPERPGLDALVKDGSLEYYLPIKTRDHATLSNALCVMATLKELGYPPSAIREKISALKSIEMRLESVVGLRDNIIVNDSFNLDFDSLTIAFQFINEYTKERKCLVLTDFVESKDKEQLYRKVTELTNQQNFQTVFLVGNEITHPKYRFNAECYRFPTTQHLIDSGKLNTIDKSVILLKGARIFEIDKLKNTLELQKHDTVLEVNLNHLLHNINMHRTYIKRTTKMMAMVKANSYGMGEYPVAEFLQHHHIDYLGVAYADEGVELRKKGITTPIMVMNPEQSSYDSIIEYGLEPEIYSFRVLDLFIDKLRAHSKEGNYPIHLKLETGMNRLGFRKDDLPALALKLNSLDVRVQSAFSHLSTSDLPSEKNFVHQQAARFNEMTSFLEKQLSYPFLKHILNSAGITNYPEYQFDMVRIGIGMLGISPDNTLQDKLLSVVRFQTVISQISEIEEGESVGYNRSFKASSPRRIATIPVGYADGIPRLLGNGVGSFAIEGHRVPIVGNICMDMLMLDVTGIECKEGDEVVVFNASPTLTEFAKDCNTIPYEALTSISPRVKRIYIKT